MKKYLFFITLMCACNGLFVKSAKLSQEGREQNFSLKNNDPGFIYFMTVSGAELKDGLLGQGDSMSYSFKADDFARIAQPTRLYIWEENLPSSIGRDALIVLKKEVLKSQLLPMDEIGFFFEPGWAYEFSPGKVVHGKWKKRELLPREGNKLMRRRDRSRHTQEGYELFNNITKDDIKNKAWVFDKKEGREKNFSLKNSDPGFIYFMAVNGGELKEGLLGQGDLMDYSFKADDPFSIAQTTRLYIWQENLPSFISPTVLEALRKEVLESQLLPIDQINFSFKPGRFYEFPPGKIIHSKWKKGELLPREGNSSIGRGGRKRHTQESYALFNNITEGDIKSNAWIFDIEEGRWLDKETILKERLDELGI